MVHPVRSIPVLLATLFCIVMQSMVLRANMANPVREGDPAGEPSAVLDSIVIEHETLMIDMRRLVDGNPATVEATYKIRNDGTDRVIELVFVANAMRAGRENRWNVWLDDRPVIGSYSDSLPLPTRWDAPKTTPGIDDAEPLRYEVAHPASISFIADLSSGVHTIRVRYYAMPTEHSRSSPALYWQLAYVLAPARRWGGFDRLNATILLPSEWKAAVTPTMERHGDTLVGVWDVIPADAFAITVQAPIPDFYWLAEHLPTLVVLVAGLILCMPGGDLVGRWLARRQRRSLLGLPFALGVGVLIAAGLFGASLFEESLTKDLMGYQLARGHGYGHLIALFLIYMPLAFVLGSVLTQWFIVRGVRRNWLAG